MDVAETVRLDRLQSAEGRKYHLRPPRPGPLSPQMSWRYRYSGFSFSFMLTTNSKSGSPVWKGGKYTLVASINHSIPSRPSPTKPNQTQSIHPFLSPMHSSTLASLRAFHTMHARTKSPETEAAKVPDTSPNARHPNQKPHHRITEPRTAHAPSSLPDVRAPQHTNPQTDRPRGRPASSLPKPPWSPNLHAQTLRQARSPSHPARSQAKPSPAKPNAPKKVTGSQKKTRPERAKEREASGPRAT